MKAKNRSAAALAAELAEDDSIQGEVQALADKSRVVRMLVQLRLDKGLTQKAIAEAMRCDQSKISRLENGYDTDLSFPDVLAYAEAAGYGVSLLFDDERAPAALRIKQHIFAIHEQLQKLAELAQKTGDDDKFVDKIHQFMGEVLFNFLLRFDDSFKKVAALKRITPAPAPCLPVPEPEGKATKTSDTLSPAH